MLIDHHPEIDLCALMKNQFSTFEVYYLTKIFSFGAADVLEAPIPNSNPPTTLGGSLMDAVTVLRENIMLGRVALLEVCM